MDQASRTLRAARDLHSTERRFAGDALFGLVRGLRRLKILTGVPRPTASQLYSAWLVDEGHAQDAAIAARKAQLDDRLTRLATLSPDEQIEALGEALSYPTWIVRALVADLGIARAQSILAAQNTRAPLTVRANALRTDRATLTDRLRGEGTAATPTTRSAWGLSLDGHVNVYGTQAFADGLLEIQDEGSQLIAELVAPPPGGVVVDVCAGAGGKTLAIGAMLGNKGRIVAMDVDGRKLEELSRRARRAGLSNVQTVRLAKDWTETLSVGNGPGQLPPWLVERGADRVLVDAPCSGLGVLRRHPEARWNLQPVDLEDIMAKQRAIVRAAAHLVRRDGKNAARLIYATCTVLHRENDAVVDELLTAQPGFVPMPAKEILGSDRAMAMGDGQNLRLFPAEGDADGFFAAVLRRERA